MDECQPQSDGNTCKFCRRIFTGCTKNDEEEEGHDHDDGSEGIFARRELSKAVAGEPSHFEPCLSCNDEVEYESTKYATNDLCDNIGK